MQLWLRLFTQVRTGTRHYRRAGTEKHLSTLYNVRRSSQEIETPSTNPWNRRALRHPPLQAIRKGSILIWMSLGLSVVGMLSDAFSPTTSAQCDVDNDWQMQQLHLTLSLRIRTPNERQVYGTPYWDQPPCIIESDGSETWWIRDSLRSTG